MNNRRNGGTQQVGDDVPAKKAKADSAAKSGKPIVDVAKPGTTTPQTGAGKPVIVSNRPIVQDPMVTPQDSASTKPTAPEVTQDDAKKSHPSKPSLVLQPLSEGGDDAGGKQEPAEPSDELKIELKPVGETGDSSPAEPAADKTADSGSATKITVSGGGSESAPDAVESDSESSTIEVKTIDSLPAEDDAEEVKAEEAAPEPKKSNKKGVDLKPLEPKQENGEPEAAKPAEEIPMDTSSPASGNADAAATAADAAKLEADARAQEELDKLVESKQFFLPITTREERRSRIRLIFGVIFAVLLVAAWINIALDAGFIEFQGVKPLTDLF